MFGFGSNKKPKEEDVKRLTELGFEKEKVIKALKENDCNPEMAANYLLKSSPGKPSPQQPNG
jgi:hypothetical protein